MIPTFVFTLWLLGLISVAIAAAAIYLGREWYLRCWEWNPDAQRSYFHFDPGWNEATALLLSAVALLLVAAFGRTILKGILKLTHRRPAGDPRRSIVRPDGHQRIQRPDGTELHVEMYGAEGAPVLVLSHGWGLNSAEWNYLKGDLSRDHRLVVWDEPGLGQSGAPTNRDYSIEKLAHDLHAVVGLAGDRPVVLLGHSIGGMITLTYCRLFQESLRERIGGLVLTHTTYTDPLRTTKGASFFMATRNVLVKPLLWLTIGLSPLVRAMAWMSYRNGTAHLSNMRSSFAGTETWEDIDFSARFMPAAPPAVLARGMFGMMRFDETNTLPGLQLPTLVVAGDRDKTTVPEASLHVVNAVPGAELVTLKPARHLGLIEHHHAYAEAVRKFVKKHVPSGALA